ncbi:hypothetical protein RHGRI_012600 [Rhododendron griersonianum]|uniref:RNA-dependent RNA polymerase n=1 Tax=Rhododendron griersonianum TaxID=479676 RepID=A0AAV6KRS7_9ERIC|nr:hypothetical protein RHGRI_012600 [Rhododendron griersonianum]
MAKALQLSFGCQTADDKFLQFFKREGTRIDFAFGNFGYRTTAQFWFDDKKLELYIENIHQIDLHWQPDSDVKFLVFQLLGGPRIYKRSQNPIDVFVRTIDFTANNSIGESSGICLKFSRDSALPNFNDYSLIFNESEGPFSVEDGSPFPSSHTVNPPTDYELQETPEGFLPVHRVQITPCKVHFSGPELNMSNRVLRKYNDDLANFLRVTFVDEEPGSILFLQALKDSTGQRTDIYGRILRTLREGIIIGQKSFEFLAYSSSQLKDNSVWMFASRDGLTVDNIRTWLGDFRQIRNVAKYAARLGQAFSSSREACSVAAKDFEIIPDVEIETDGSHYVFSDGIGKISADFARIVAFQCGLGSFTPSAFQIRYGGYKGVVAVDPTSPKKLSLRNSMCKYISENRELDLLAWSKYQPCFLNRQLITLLSTLGVKDEVFLKKQRESILNLDVILKDPLKELNTLEVMGPEEIVVIVKDMLTAGYMPEREPFLEMVLQTFRAANLLKIRDKTRIFISDGRSMMGCLDETKTLEYGQVFVQTSGTGSNESEKYKVNKGKLFVAKSPCLHPGDVRVLEAVDVLDLHHLVDCLVFPQKGSRPHPNECSGSDLDGDVYIVCWDAELIPPWEMAPMDYTPAESVELDHEITIKEVQEYFVNYIGNDSTGTISNAHVVYADQEPEKAASATCIRLAELFSQAVDSAKSGVRVELPKDLRISAFPDFMEKPHKRIYESQGVLGKLFRESKCICTQSNSVREVASDSYDPCMETEEFRDYLEVALEQKNIYDCKLRKIMKCYGILTEGEIVSGNIIKMKEPFHPKKNGGDVKAQVDSLKREMRTWLNEDEYNDDKASASYHVTYHPTYYGQETGEEQPFISFPWCFHKNLLSIKASNS